MMARPEKETPFAAFKRTPAGYFLVGPGDLEGLVAKPRMRLIDVREPSEFNADLGHLEGAELVPLATVAARSKTWPVEDPLIMVCRSGRRSAEAAQVLVQSGFRDVANLVGGMMAVRAGAKQPR